MKHKSSFCLTLVISDSIWLFSLHFQVIRKYLSISWYRIETKLLTLIAQLSNDYSSDHTASSLQPPHSLQPPATSVWWWPLRVRSPTPASPLKRGALLAPTPTGTLGPLQSHSTQTHYWRRLTATCGDTSSQVIIDARLLYSCWGYYKFRDYCRRRGFYRHQGYYRRRCYYRRRGYYRCRGYYRLDTTR